MVADQRGIRRANLGVVLRLVAAEGESSRARIALRTALNKSTVSSLVTELIKLNLLAETGEDEYPGRVGRPARLVRLNGRAVVGVGLEVDVDSLTVCATDIGGQVRHHARVKAQNAASRPGPVLRQLAGLAAQAIAELRADGAVVAGVALALPGLVDRSGRTLVVAPNLGWHDVPAAEALSELLPAGLPVTVDNEANLAALAEHWEGAAQDLDEVVCVSAAVGIGAAVLSAGELHRGAHGFAGELGHIPVDPAGEECACGNRGCLETIAGRDAVLDRAMVRATGTGGARELLARAHAQDSVALTALRDTGRALGIALAAVVNLVDPQAIVLGGYLGPLTEWLEPPMARELERRVLASAWSVCEIRAAALGEDAAARGAAARVLRDVLADPARIIEVDASAPRIARPALP